VCFYDKKTAPAERIKPSSWRKKCIESINLFE